MPSINLDTLVSTLKGQRVERPNKADNGTLSGHAAGEPFEKLVYKILKERHPENIFKQFEYLNDLYLKHPKNITMKQRSELFESPTAHYLLSRSAESTREWSPESLFEEKQNDTADILFTDSGKYTIIDVKTRNNGKKAQPPNIISSYKLANACALMLENEDYDTIDFKYVEVMWETDGNELVCVDSHYCSLFKAPPEDLYINWAAAMQIQFIVHELEQTYPGNKEKWSRDYLKHFVDVARAQRDKIEEKFVKPFLKYIQ